MLKVRNLDIIPFSKKIFHQSKLNPFKELTVSLYDAIFMLLLTSGTVGLKRSSFSLIIDNSLGQEWEEDSVHISK